MTKVLIVLNIAPRRGLIAAALICLIIAPGCKPTSRKQGTSAEANAAASSAPATPNTVGPGTGKLKRAVDNLEMETYTENGHWEESDTEQGIVAPWLLTVTKPLDPRIQTPSDKELLATNVAKTLHGGLVNVRVLSTTPITIDGVDGYEFLVDADSDVANKTLSVYFAVLFPGDQYTIIRGSIEKSLADQGLPEFRAMAHGWHKPQ